MKWLKRLFSTEREFVGDFVNTGEELMELVRSNPVVATEYEQFEKQVAKLEEQKLIEQTAVRSANALSGYGISVTAKAFLETLEK